MPDQQHPGFDLIERSAGIRAKVPLYFFESMDIPEQALANPYMSRNRPFVWLTKRTRKKDKNPLRASSEKSAIPGKSRVVASAFLTRESQC